MRDDYVNTQCGVAPGVRVAPSFPQEGVEAVNAKPQAALDHVMDELRKALMVLHEDIDILLERLSLVMLPQESSETSEKMAQGVTQAHTPESPLTSRLIDHLGGIRMATQRLRALMDRLDT